jgi:hypothetical protein
VARCAQSESLVPLGVACKGAGVLSEFRGVLYLVWIPPWMRIYILTLLYHVRLTDREFFYGTIAGS